MANWFKKKTLISMSSKPKKLEHQSQPPPPSPSPSHYYSPLQTQNDETPYVVLPPQHLHPPTISLPSKRILIITAIIFLSISFFYLFWPSDPTLKIVRLRLNKLHIHALPIINIDVSLHVTIKVRNLDVYSMDFTELDVSLRYRGKRLGHVKSGRGHVKALASSYVDAELEFSGVGVLSDVVFLLEDLAKGKVPFDTVTKVDGKFGFWFFELPLKALLSCEILVNTTNQTIVRDNCVTEL